MLSVDRPITQSVSTSGGPNGTLTLTLEPKLDRRNALRVSDQGTIFPCCDRLPGSVILDRREHRVTAHIACRWAIGERQNSLRGECFRRGRAGGAFREALSREFPVPHRRIRMPVCLREDTSGYPACDL